MFQVNTTYLQSLPCDCCLICHAPRTDSKSQPHNVPDTTGIGHVCCIYLQMWHGIGRFTDNYR